MWQLERRTVRRTALSSAILARVLRARRKRATFFVHECQPLLLLGFLEHHNLVRITDALAPVRLGLPVGAHFCSDLADLLLVGTLDNNLGLGGVSTFTPAGI